MEDRAYVKGPTDRELIKTSIHEYFSRFGQTLFAHRPLLKVALQTGEAEHSEDIEERTSKRQFDTYDFARFNREAKILAYHLQAMGLQPGDAVGLCLPTGAEWAVSFLAILYAGGAAVLLNPTYSPTELRDLAAFVDCSFLIICDEFKERNHLTTIAGPLNEVCPVTS